MKTETQKAELRKFAENYKLWSDDKIEDGVFSCEVHNFLLSLFADDHASQFKVELSDDIFAEAKEKFKKDTIKAENEFWGTMELSDEEINKMAEEKYKELQSELSKFGHFYLGNFSVGYIEGFKSSLQHREDKAVGFVEWLNRDNYINIYSTRGSGKLSHRYLTTKELYELYLTSIKGK